MNGVVAGRYEILEPVGEGPLLSAFRARDRALNRVVAVKTLASVYQRDRTIVDAVRDGLSQVLSLSHPAIARPYDVGIDEGGDNDVNVFVVEEFVRGIDLKERIRKYAPFALNVATDIAIALAEGLEFAHVRGVVHGDVRPQNVLVTAEGAVKLINFGLAPALLVARIRNPEQFQPFSLYQAGQGDVAASTAEGDLHALGVLLFEMLTGELPTSQSVSPRTLNPGVPRALEGIVQKAMRAEGGTEYASAAQLLHDLRAVRDALRFNKSLDWSPLDPASLPMVTKTVPIPREIASAPRLPANNAGGDRAIHAVAVMPMSGEAVVAPANTGSGANVGVTGAKENNRRIAPPPAEIRPSVAPVAREENRRPVRSSTNRWLTALNLFLFLLVLGGIGFIALQTANFLKVAPDVIVPNLVGRTTDEAKALAAQQGFLLNTIDQQHRDREPKGVIYAMNPQPGRHIREGKPVAIWVSLGPKMAPVPDVREMAFEKARREIEKNGLKVGEVTKEFDNTSTKGNVLRQKPETGEEMPLGSRVNLVLSKGPEPSPTPTEPPIAPPDVNTTPPPDTNAAGIDSGTDNGGTPSGTGDGTSVNPPDIRFFDVKYSIPNDNQRHQIRIDVTDKRGTNTVYNQPRHAGEHLKEQVEGRGAAITFRVYDNDVKATEQNITTQQKEQNP